MMSTFPKTIDDATYQQFVSEADRPVVLDFWADWCPPCKLITPWLERLAAQHAGQIAVGLVNVDDCPEMVAHFNIQSMPTLLFLKDGQIVHRQLERFDEAGLGQLVVEHLLGNAGA